MSDGAAISGSEDRASWENPLEAARKALGMTRKQVVTKVNAYIRARTGDNSADVIDVGLLGKLERGDHKTPRGPLRREALLQVLRLRSGAELGWPEPTSADRRAGSGERAGLRPDAKTDLGAILDEATNGVARAASVTQARTVSSTLLQAYRSRLVKLSTDFVHLPAEEVGPKLHELWKDVSVHLERGPRQHQGRDVYLAAGTICAVLAHLCHVHGRPYQGLVHAEAALMWAQDAGHRVLLAWTLGTKALLTGSTEGPIAALQIIEQAKDVLRESPLPGSGAVRLACYEAKYCAEADQRERGLAAIRASEDATEALGARGPSDLDLIGGILSFSETKRAALCADPYLGFGCAESAEQHAKAAISGYLTGPAEQRSYGDMALSQVTMGRARMAAGDLDGVLEAVRPVLALPPPQRIAPVREQLGRLVSTLSTPRFLHAAEATQIRAEITEFEHPAQAPLPM